MLLQLSAKLLCCAQSMTSIAYHVAVAVQLLDKYTSLSCGQSLLLKYYIATFSTAH